MTLLATIAVMAFLDTLFLTGYFFYGAGITAVTSVAILGDYSFLSILIAICVGAFIGDMVNYAAGRFFSDNPKVQQVIAKTNKVKLLSTFMHHHDDTLLRKTFLASLFRLLAVLRPVNAILLAVSTRNSVRNFLALAVAVILWSTAWLLVISGIMSAFF